MVDYSEMRRKFKAKNPGIDAARKRSREAVKRIAREYEQKRAELGLNGPKLKRTPAYYMILILIMILLAGAFIAMMTGKVGWGKRRISKADLQARQSMDALAQALGRYRFHCGVYPTTREGLAALAAITPQKKGWFGPYIRQVVPDPWGEPYQYWTRDEGGHPVLLSKGPDRRLGTSDDVLPDQTLFDLPFRDTTWTNHWVPYNLRGVVVAPDERTRKAIQEEVKNY